MAFQIFSSTQSAQQTSIDNSNRTSKKCPQHHCCTAGCGSSTEQATAHGNPEVSVRLQPLAAAHMYNACIHLLEAVTGVQTAQTYSSSFNEPGTTRALWEILFLAHYLHFYVLTPASGSSVVLDAPCNAWSRCVKSWNELAIQRKL